MPRTNLGIDGSVGGDVVRVVVGDRHHARRKARIDVVRVVRAARQQLAHPGRSVAPAEDRWFACTSIVEISRKFFQMKLLFAEN